MKKTTNKGFSMVELIIVIAIMAILAAALAPSLIKYINKSRLSTDLSTGNSIVSAATSAMAVEKANDEVASYAAWTDVNSVLKQKTSNSFASEFANVMAVDTVTGKSKKDVAGNGIPNAGVFYMQISGNAVNVAYGATDADHMISPTTGASLVE